MVAGASAAPIAAVHFALGLSLPSGGGSGGGSDAPFRTFPAALGAAGRHALYATLLTLAWAGGANGLAAAGREALKMGPRHGGPPLKVNDWRVAGVGAAAGAAAGAGVAAAAAAVGTAARLRTARPLRRLKSKRRMSAARATRFSWALCPREAAVVAAAVAAARVAAGACT